MNVERDATHDVAEDAALYLNHAAMDIARACGVLAKATDYDNLRADLAGLLADLKALRGTLLDEVDE